jgi:hypothetical protein
MKNKVIQNFIAKMVAGRSDDGIMITLRDPKKVQFQAAMLEDLLMRNGINPNAITSEAQLKSILNQIEAFEKKNLADNISGIRNTTSAKVFDLEGKEIPRGSKIMGGKEVPGTSERDRVRNEMKTKYGFTDERLDEIENTPIDEEMADRLLAETDQPPLGSRGGDEDIAAPVQSAEESLKDMTEAELKANLEKQNKSAVENILKRKNREDVYGLEDYDTTNMSGIKKEIIRTETKLGNLNPDDPNFRAKAKPLIDKIEALKNKLREDKADGGRIGLKSGTLLESLGFTPEHSAAIDKMDKNFSGSQFDYAAASTKDMVDRASNPVTAVISAAGNVIGRPFYDFVDAAKEYSKTIDEKGNPIPGGGYQGEFSFTPQGAIDFTKNVFSLGKEFIDQKPATMMAGALKGGIQSLGTQLGESIYDAFNPQEISIDPTSKNLFTQYYEDDPYAGIKNQTALLDPFTVIGGLTKVAKGANAKTLVTNYFKQKAKEKVGKEIYNKIQKKINTPKYPATTTKPGTGGGGSGGPPGTGTTTKSTSKSTGGSNPYGGGAGGLHSGYADGGRIGLKFGSGKRFLQRVFGKQGLEDMKDRDPEMYVGLLEVVDMYRKRDKEGLKMYLQKFLPHMDDEAIEAFIKGSDGSEGLMGELIRLGSGRDYAGKLEMIKRAQEMRKLDDLDITEDMRRKPNADGGIMRLGLKEGSGMSRRTFLKLLGGAMSIPIVGKILKPFKTAKGVTKVPMIKTDNVPGKPEWFDQLVNKVIIEGDDVTKKLATVEREIVHTKKINDTDEVTVYQDLNTDSVRVEYKSPDNMMEEQVDLMYKRTPPDEGSPQASSEFEVAESGFVGRADGPDDYFIDAEEVGGRSIKDLDSDVSALKEYATGQKPTMKEIVQKMKRKEKVKKLNEGDLDAQSDYITARQGDYSDYDYASGGIARMLGE